MDELPRLSRTHRKAAIQVASLAAYKVADFGVVKAAKQLPNSPFATYKVTDFRIARAAKQLLPPDTRIGFLHEQKADFFMKFEVPQRQQLACAPESAGGGCCVHRGPLKTHSVPQKPVLRTEYPFRTTEGGFRYRISLLYQKSLFFTPSAPENAFGAEKGGFHAPKTHSVPQEALYGTECHKHDAVTSCGADYRVINTLITATRLITAIPSWKPPGTRSNRFAEKPLQLFQKIAGTFTQFFYICAE